MLKQKRIPRASHSISSKQISPNAIKVMHRLNEAGYDAYLVGGAVRDLIAGLSPKDFDVVTNAHPEEIHQLFRNSRLIGRRFRLAHVYFKQEVIEVSTFRALHDTEDPQDQNPDFQIEQGGRVIRDNVYGTMDEDAARRDFTVNALYYSLRSRDLIDYADGVKDLKRKVLRMIGQPHKRFMEDPVRMLRAIRFSQKLDLTMTEDLAHAIREHGDLLRDIPPARLFDESLKILMSGQAAVLFEMLCEYDLLRYLFPAAAKHVTRDENRRFDRFIKQAMLNTDERISQGKPVTPAFLYASLLWKAFEEERDRLVNDGMHPAPAVQKAANRIFDQQVKFTAMPKRFSIPAKEIWDLQKRFEFRKGKRPLSFVTHPRFRAAYDFMLLRNESGEDLQELADWWTEFQTFSPEEQQRLVQVKKKPRKTRKRKPSSSSHSE